ncbi:MAG: 30S ribosomal protein S8 [bacterium]|nr:30S ribosomal protein S8 [bacterium]
MITDPIANMLTSVRNAQAARKPFVRVPYSRLKKDIADVLRQAGYVGPVSEATDDSRKSLEVTLLYDAAGQPRIRGIKRVSKPGRRWYVRRREIPRVLSGLGVAVLSTPQGLLTDAEARKRGLGGEVICTVW